VCCGVLQLVLQLVLHLHEHGGTYIDNIGTDTLLLGIGFENPKKIKNQQSNQYMWVVHEDDLIYNYSTMHEGGTIIATTNFRFVDENSPFVEIQPHRHMLRVSSHRH